MWALPSTPSPSALLNRRSWVARAALTADTEGLGQAKKDAQKLQARFAFSTNGADIYRVDMQTGEEG